MNPTPISLLDRLRNADRNHADWLRLRDIYQPLIRGWLSRVPGLGDEADDLTQEVFLVLFREIPRFDRRREGSFRKWLRLIVVNKVRNERRRRIRRPVVGLDPADQFLDQLADTSGDLAREWDRDHDTHVFEKLLKLVRVDFEPGSWEAFRRSALEGMPPRLVAEELGLTENAVLQAKYRILKRLRQEAGQLLD